MKKTLFLSLIIAGAACGSPALAQSEDSSVNNNGMTCFNGYAYTLKGDDYRYTEHHEQKRANGKLSTWDVTYVGDNGKVIATKHMDFSASQTVPVYTLKMPASGYEEGISHDGGTWTMFRKDSSSAKKQTKNFQIDPPMAADSGFDPLVQEHFKSLMAGKTVNFKFAAAGRQSVISLKAHKTGTTTFEGKPAVQFEAELDMFLVNMFVSSLNLTFDPKTQQLLEYRGIGNMHNAKGEVYPVKVTYSDQMPAVAKKDGAPAASCGSADSMTNG